MKSFYSSSLTYDSNQFFRIGNTYTYYYQAIDIIVNITGNYTLKSNCTMDTYGYLYNNSFDKTKLSLNQVKQDDDSGGNLQFQLISVLRSGMRSILIVTTYGPNIRGPFSLIVSGPATVGFRLFSTATTTTTTSTTSSASKTTTTTSKMSTAPTSSTSKGARQ